MKTDEQLANVLSRAFKSYANRMAIHHLVEPYRPFLEGAESVNVKVSLLGRNIEVSKIEEETVEESTEEIKGIKKEAKKPLDEEIILQITSDKKPKRRRKKD